MSELPDGAMGSGAPSLGKGSPASEVSSGHLRTGDQETKTENKNKSMKDRDDSLLMLVVIVVMH